MSPQSVARLVLLLVCLLHVGCDGVVGSLKQEDACGICGGDNSTCRLVSGLFTRPQMPAGYNMIAQVPRGACNLSISELKQSRNYLALRREDGTYVLNGNWAINWSGDYDGVGTKFSYKRQDAVLGESISAQGPLTEPIDLMVIYQQPNPGIKYEYMLPMRHEAPAPPLVLQAPQTNQEELAETRRSDNVLYPYGVLGTDTQGQTVTRPRTKKRKFTWKTAEFTKCSKSCGGGIQTSIVMCVREHNNQPVSFKRCGSQEKPLPQSLRCNVKPCLAEWVGGEWGPCSVTCGEGVQHRDIMCKQEITQTLTMKVAEGACLSPMNLAKTQTCSQPACSVSKTRWQAGSWGQCSATCGEGTRSRTIQCASTQMDDCPDNQRPNHQESCNNAACPSSDSTSWLFTDWTSHCSEACGQGVQTRRVICPGFCDVASKPDERRGCASDKQCSGKWFTGPWGHCSARCGVGKEVRHVICMAFTRGLYHVAPDHNCAGVPKPDLERSCETKSCNHEWFTTDWTQCSKECGNGMQWREVKCLNEKGQSSEECSESHEPSGRRTCNSHRCSEPTTHHKTHLESPKTEPHVLSVDDQAQPNDDDGSECRDKFPNCHLVVQSRLCGYKYYRSSCCVSCENKPY